MPASASVQGFVRTNWQPIETAPMAEWVLVWGPTSIVRSAAQCRMDGVQWWTDGGMTIKAKLTHWAPLPEPPDAYGEGQKR